jgi:hypothetical protein
MMSELGWQAVGLGLLVVTVIAAYLAAMRRGAPDDRGTPIAILALAATLAGGFWGAFAWWPDYSGGFSWDLPPLVARMLAAPGSKRSRWPVTIRIASGAR